MVSVCLFLSQCKGGENPFYALLMSNFEHPDLDWCFLYLIRPIRKSFLVLRSTGELQ